MNKTKLLQIRCDDGFLELLDKRAEGCGLDRTSYIKLVVTKSEVRVLREDEGKETKVSIEREIKSEANVVPSVVPSVVKELQAKVDRVKEEAPLSNSSTNSTSSGLSTGYKTGDIFVKNEASEDYDRLRRATVAFCFQNDIADESLLNKAQKEFIEKNIPKLLGEVGEEARVAEPMSKEEFKQIWLNEHGVKDLNMNHPSKFKTFGPRKKKGEKGVKK